MTQGNPDDATLVAQLDTTRSAEWKELCDLAENFTTSDHEVQLNPGQRDDGALHFPYHVYSQSTSRACELLSLLGAVTPLYHWRDNSPINIAPDNKISTADAVRAATAMIRGERFVDGTIARAVTDGTLQAVVTSLAAWYRTYKAS